MRMHKVNICEILNEFQSEAEKKYNELLENDFPFPSILPVGLFNCLRHDKWETDYTRTFAYLLDKTKNHGYNDIFMQKLCKSIGIPLFDQYDICPEKYFEDGRFDIFIQGTSQKKNYLNHTLALQHTVYYLAACRYLAQLLHDRTNVCERQQLGRCSILRSFD